MNDTAAPKKLGFLARLGFSRKQWESKNIAPAQDITQSRMFEFGLSATTVASLLGSEQRGARTRAAIYDKWSRMEGDPIIASALQVLVTSALGGHETTGDLIFIEKKPEADKNKQLAAIVDEITTQIAPLLNQWAFQIAYTGAVYGDAYARIYTKDKEGIVHLQSDELIRPPLVQPFERAGRTVGYAVSVGERHFERLDASQMVRLKMPRTQWIPQHGVMEKSLKVALPENDIDNLPIMPSMAGGSLLYNAELPYDNLNAALLGLVGQRWIDSIDEQIMAVNMDSMSLDQQSRFLESVKGMILKSKHYAEAAAKGNRPILERIRHIIPIFNEKQLINITPNAGHGRAGSVNIEDVLLHARLLAGALGVDLSMIGFADQLSGGLGEGGFFRVSAQAAERARMIRGALSEFCNAVIDQHTLHKWGVIFPAGQRPWQVNFYGSISALEAERQRTRTDMMNAGMLLVQSMQSLKDLGASREIMVEFLSKTMMLDEAQAKLFAGVIEAGENENAAQNPQQAPAEEEAPEESSEETNEEDDAVLDAVGHSHWITLNPQTVQWLGFNGVTMKLQADLGKLVEKHPEWLDNEDAARAMIDYVMDAPENWFIHKGARVAIIRQGKTHSRGGKTWPLVRVELQKNGKNLTVHSVFASNDPQIAHKLKEKEAVLKALMGDISENNFIRVADYWKILKA